MWSGVKCSRSVAGSEKTGRFRSRPNATVQIALSGIMQNCQISLLFEVPIARQLGPTFSYLAALQRLPTSRERWVGRAGCKQALHPDRTHPWTGAAVERSPLGDCGSMRSRISPPMNGSCVPECPIDLDQCALLQAPSSATERSSRLQVRGI